MEILIEPHVLAMGDVVTVSLSPTQALSICLFLSSYFVGLLYIWNLWPSMKNLSRNNKAVIICRFISASVVCLTTPLILHYFDVKLLGLHFSFQYLERTFWALVITMIWFFGPLVHYHFQITSRVVVNNGVFSRLSLVDAYKYELNQGMKALKKLKHYRNVLIAPFAEEWVFRGAMVSVLVAGGYSETAAGWLAPLFFGVAHLHHLYEHVIIQKEPLVSGLAQVAFQFTYTTLFGWYSSFLLVKSSTILAPIVAHCFCNFMGFPQFGDIRRHSKKNAIIACYALGLIGIFFLLLQPYTVSATPITHALHIG